MGRKDEQCNSCNGITQRRPYKGEMSPKIEFIFFSLSVSLFLRKKNISEQEFLLIKKEILTCREDLHMQYLLKNSII